MSLTERLTATLRPLLPLLPALSRRSLRIYLAPSMLVASAIDGERITGVAALPVTNPGGQWEAPLAMLRALLARPAETLAGQARQPDAQATQAIHPADAVLAALAGQAPLSVSLSGHWCQSVMAPWSDALLAEPAATRFLQMQLAAVYGDAARGWSIANDDAPYGEPRAACGIDAQLLQALRADLGKRCGAIEPVIGTACRMPTGMAAFAIVEAGKLTMATMAQGRISAICSQPSGPAWPQELQRAWQRWTLRMPELDSVTAIAVIDLACQPSAGQALPPLFHLVDTPFGPPSMLIPAVKQEVLCA